MSVYCRFCNGIIPYTLMAVTHISQCPQIDMAHKPLFRKLIQEKPSAFFWYFSSTQYDLAQATRRREREEEEELRRRLREARKQEVDEIEEVYVEDFFHNHKEVIDQAVSSPFVRDTVKKRLLDIKNSEKQLREFQWRNFAARLRITGEVQNLLTFYRKISGAEWSAIREGNTNTSPDPFKPVFEFQNSNLYRYWMSSSLDKVRAFGNENATDASEIIIVINFKLDPWSRFKMALHQKQGTQGDAKVVAVHREGFAEIAGFSTDEELAEVGDRKPRLDHNLGFTDSQYKDLLSITGRVERLTF